MLAEAAVRAAPHHVAGDARPRVVPTGPGWPDPRRCRSQRHDLHRHAARAVRERRRQRGPECRDGARSCGHGPRRRPDQIRSARAATKAAGSDADKLLLSTAEAEPAVELARARVVEAEAGYKVRQARLAAATGASEPDRARLAREAQEAHSDIGYAQARLGEAQNQAVRARRVAEGIAASRAQHADWLCAGTSSGSTIPTQAARLYLDAQRDRKRVLPMGGVTYQGQWENYHGRAARAGGWLADGGRNDRREYGQSASSRNRSGSRRWPGRHRRAAAAAERPRGAPAPTRSPCPSTTRTRRSPSRSTTNRAGRLRNRRPAPAESRSDRRPPRGVPEPIDDHPQPAGSQARDRVPGNPPARRAGTNRPDPGSEACVRSADEAVPEPIEPEYARPPVKAAPTTKGPTSGGAPTTGAEGTGTDRKTGAGSVRQVHARRRSPVAGSGSRALHPARRSTTNVVGKAGRWLGPHDSSTPRARTSRRT
jgi:hypothetical protein